MDSRAVLRTIPAGFYDRCVCCNVLITWVTGKKRDKIVLANVYRGPKKRREWDRTEIWCRECYDGQEVYGPAV